MTTRSVVRAPHVALLIPLLIPLAACPGEADDKPADKPHIERVPAAAWRQTVIDDDVGALASAAVQADASGRLHVAYNPRRDDLRYAVGDRDGFSIITLGASSGDNTWAPALALAGSRAPGGASIVPDAWHEPSTAASVEVAIAWSRHDTGELRYARLDPEMQQVGVEATVIARTSGSGFSSTALEIDADGVPHLAWLAGVMDMMYAPRLQHSWQSENGQFIADEIADAALDEGVALALDADGAPHALYFDRALYHAVRTDGVWRSEFVGAQGNGLDPSLAIGADGELHVLCGGDGAHYAHGTDDGWTIERLEDGAQDGLRSSVVLDADGLVHGVWVSGGALEVVQRDADGDFRIEPIEVELAEDSEPAIVILQDGSEAVIADVVRDDGSSALVLLERER